MIIIKLTMRLYKRHDADLLCLYKQTNYSLQKAIKQATLAYLNHSDDRVGYPDVYTSLADLPSTAQFHLYLSAENEDDMRIVNFVSSIPAGFKNSLLKNITRYYLAQPVALTIKDKKIQLESEGDLPFGRSEV